MIVRPGLVYPSAIAATKTDYDCEVGSLLTRESRELLKSIESNALSTFLARSSIGEDARFSSWKERFDSSTGYQYGEISG